MIGTIWTVIQTSRFAKWGVMAAVVAALILGARAVWKSEGADEVKREAVEDALKRETERRARDAKRSPDSVLDRLLGDWSRD